MIPSSDSTHSGEFASDVPRPPRWRLFGLQGQLIFPYAFLTLGLALIGFYVVTQLVAAQWEERFRNQLDEASRMAADGIVLIERDHLEDLRLIVSVPSLSADLLQRDSQRLSETLCPLVLNGHVEILTALDVTGHEILTLTPDAAEPLCLTSSTALDFSTLPLVRGVLADIPDAQGDKFAAFLSTAIGPALFTSAPVRAADGHLSGVLLVGSRLEALLARIKSQTLADVVALDGGGQRLASTIPEPQEGYAVLELSAAEAAQVLPSLSRTLTLNGRTFQAVYAPLVIRRQTAGVLGVLLSNTYVVTTQITSRNSFVGLFLVGTLGVILVGYTLSQSIIRPIVRLRDMAQTVAAGNLNERAGLRRPDEIGDLVTAFDTMTDRLRERTDETERLYAEARYRNIELAESNARLQSAQQQLIQSEKLAAIGQLTAGIVHDVKNPLTVILGLSELLRDSPELKRQAAAELELIYNSAQRANRIVSELLTFARQSTPEMQRQDWRATIEAAVRLNTYLAREAHVKIELDLPPQAVELVYDAQQIEQVLVNLIHNAIQAMPHGGLLALRLRPEHGGATLTVTDSGVGIPPENLSRVFDPFFTTKPAGEGTGLGLSVSHGIVARHHGHIAADSEMGRGTTFTVWLPTEQPAP